MRARTSVLPCLLIPLLLSLSRCSSIDGPQEPKYRRVDKAVSAPSDAVPSEPPGAENQITADRYGGSKKDKAYRVRGKTYYPVLSTKGYEERGIASWYGPSFHGKKTSCGETFDMYRLTAAHRLLPMYTKIDVTNLENGRSTTLTVNDRGPFAPGRILDLSYEAAKNLGMVEKGFARVVIRASGQIQGLKNNDLIGEFFVHVGSCRSERDARHLLEDMKSLKYRSSMIKVIRDDRDGETIWRVELGPYKSMSFANRAHAATVKDYPSAFIVAKDDLSRPITALPERKVISWEE